MCSFQSNEHIHKKVDGIRLSSILVSIDKFKAFYGINKMEKKEEKMTITSSRFHESSKMITALNASLKAVES